MPVAGRGGHNIAYPAKKDGGVREVSEKRAAARNKLQMLTAMPFCLYLLSLFWIITVLGLIAL